VKTHPRPKRDALNASFRRPTFFETVIFDGIGLRVSTAPRRARSKLRLRALNPGGTRVAPQWRDTTGSTISSALGARVDGRESRE